MKYSSIYLFPGIFNRTFTRNIISVKRFSTEVSPSGSESVESLKTNFKTSDASPSIKSNSVLTDSFGRKHTYLRISLTERCNLRCQYCMPEEGVKLSQKTKLLTTDEILNLAALFAKQGVTKIRLTGGEPTLNKDIVHIVEGLKRIPGIETVGITTNGVTLTRSLAILQRAGLDQVNISLDSLRPDRFALLTRRPPQTLARVIAAIDLAIQLGYSPVKVNVVLMKGMNDDEAVHFVKWTEDRPVDIRFIEYMPFTGNRWETDKMVPYSQLLKTIQLEFPDFHPMDNGPNDTSKAYKVPGFSGQVGFITSMTEHFCSSCNRLRLMADGSLKVCLFGNKEISLRDALRSGCSEDDLLTMIGLAVGRKKKQHAGMLNLAKMPNRPMILIGQQTGKPALGMRLMSSNAGKLTHVSDDGKANMVDVSRKEATRREAVAEGIVILGLAWQSVKENSLKKGDAIGVARLAGIMAAKSVPQLIPLCHSVPLSKVWVNVDLGDGSGSGAVRITAGALTTASTGVEMEALTAVSVTALTLYDMCKAINKSIIIKSIRLLSKTGGKSADYSAPIS